MFRGLTSGEGHFQGAAAYPGSNPCQSIRGSTGRSHRWGCRSRYWHRSRAGHNPAQSALQHTLWTQDSLAPALSPVILRPPPTHSCSPRSSQATATVAVGSQIQVGTAPLSTPISRLHLLTNEFPSCAHNCILQGGSVNDPVCLEQVEVYGVESLDLGLTDTSGEAGNPLLQWVPSSGTAVQSSVSQDHTPSAALIPLP